MSSKGRFIAVALLLFAAPLLGLERQAGLTEEQKITHVLNRLGYGPRPGDVERVKEIGIEKYIEEQLHPERVDDSALEARLSRLERLEASPAEMANKFRMAISAGREGRRAGRQDLNEEELEKLREQRRAAIQEVRRAIGELQAAKVLRAIYSERQLYEVMVDFWMNHFNIFAGKGADRFLISDYEHNTIRPHAMGKFEDLLMATAKSPAMLFYLDNWMSVAENAQLPRRRAPRGRARRGLNENYARELLELHTLGVDGGYSQKDVIEVARCFTGWTIQRPQRGFGFRFEPRLHDSGEKIVLGRKVKEGGIKDGEKVIEMLARHPSTARFIATKLVRRFVSDQPPESLVERVAKIFLQTDGDIRSLLRAIFSSPEFFSPEAFQAKVKRPLEYVASAARALGAEVEDARPLVMSIARMGEPLYLYQPPTGLPDEASAWINTGMLLERMAFAAALSTNRLPGVKANSAAGPGVAVKDMALFVGSPEFQRR